MNDHRLLIPSFFVHQKNPKGLLGAAFYLLQIHYGGYASPKTTSTACSLHHWISLACRIAASKDCMSPLHVSLQHHNIKQAADNVQQRRYIYRLWLFVTCSQSLQSTVHSRIFCNEFEILYDMQWKPTTTTTITLKLRPLQRTPGVDVLLKRRLACLRARWPFCNFEALRRPADQGLAEHEWPTLLVRR